MQMKIFSKEEKMIRRIVCMGLVVLALFPSTLYGQGTVAGWGKVVGPIDAPKAQGACQGKVIGLTDIVWVLCAEENLEILLDITHTKQEGPTRISYVLVVIHYLPDGSMKGWFDITFPLSGLPSGLYKKVDDPAEIQEGLLQGFMKRGLGKFR